MGEQNQYIYEFGPFRLDPQRRLLLREGEPVKLYPKEFDTLLALVERNGEGLDKDELMRRVWGETVVEEGNLAKNISHLRKVLGEKPSQHQYIVTVPGRGYRFVAGVRAAAFDEVVVRERTRVTVEQEEESSIADCGLRVADSRQSALHADAPAVSVVRASRGQSATRNPQSAILLAVSALVSLLVLGVAAFVWMRGDKARTAAVPVQPAPTPEQKAASEPMMIVRLSDLGSASGTSISPDGKFVAYAQNYTHGTGSLYVRQIDTNAEAQLLEPGERVFGTTAFSPDGAFIYYIARDERSGAALYRIPVLGGLPVKVLDNAGLMFTLSADGKQATFFRDEPEQKQKSLIVAALDGSGERKVLTRRWDEMQFSSCPAFSPDGAMIAFGAIEAPKTVNRNEPNVKVYTFNLKGGEVRKISEEAWRGIGKMIWMPDASGLLFIGDRRRTGQQIYFLSYLAGEAKRITTDLNFYGNYGLDVTADGKTLVATFRESSAQLWSVGADGSTARAEKLTTGASDGPEGLTSLPDGSIVYVGLTGDTWDLWKISEADGRRERKPLTSDDFVERYVSASAGGSFLVFTSDRAGNRHLFRMDADGSNVRQLTFGDGFETAPDISPDGKWIAYNSESKLWKIPAEGGASVQLTDYECVVPSFSPDGQFIACILPLPLGEQIKNATLAVLSSDGGEPLKRFEVVPYAWEYRIPRWTPDGRALVFRKIANQISNLWKQNLSGGEPKPLTDFKSEAIFNYIFSRGRHRLIVSRGRSVATTVMLKNFR